MFIVIITLYMTHIYTSIYVSYVCYIKFIPHCFQSFLTINSADINLIRAAVHVHL